MGDIGGRRAKVAGTLAVVSGVEAADSAGTVVLWYGAMPFEHVAGTFGTAFLASCQ